MNRTRALLLVTAVPLLIVLCVLASALLGGHDEAPPATTTAPRTTGTHTTGARTTGARGATGASPHLPGPASGQLLAGDDARTAGSGDVGSRVGRAVVDDEQLADVGIAAQASRHGPSRDTFSRAG